MQNVSDFYPRPPRGGRLLADFHAALCGAFLSTPSARRATRLYIPRSTTVSRFLSTPSARRATPPARWIRRSSRYFYPRPPRGGRHHRQGGYAGVQDISIHALREEGDVRQGPTRQDTYYFYPRPPRGGRHSTIVLLVKNLHISIHALREEGDRCPYRLHLHLC